MNRIKGSLAIVLIIFITGCANKQISKTKEEDGKLTAVFVQLNDVYEIAPLSGGNSGGMARVATLGKQYKKDNRNTFMVMAGDFLSPSVYNSLQYKGERIRGKQMVESMNAAGFDFAIFGNHEFDITEKELQQRINESTFQWISSNAFHVVKDQVIPFEKQGGSLNSFPTAHVLSLRDEDGTTARIGLLGIVLPFNRQDYVAYTDALSTAREIYDQLKDSCDAIIAITHQLMADDVKLANELPGLTAILGGHEHDMKFEKVGNVFIMKAHANAKSAYIVNVEIDKRNKQVYVNPQLKEIDQKIPFDAATKAVVDKWIAIADQNYASIGFDPKQIIIKTGEPLDGRESLARKQPTNLTKLIIDAMSYATPLADVVIVNAGSIRLDDILYTPISQYDILRTLPYGGGIREVEMRGRLLIRTLDAGLKNSATGGYLHASPVVYDSVTKVWSLKNQPLEANKIYRVAVTDFLLTGREANLDFLNEKNSDITKVHPAVQNPDPASDIRLAIVQYLAKKKS